MLSDSDLAALEKFSEIRTELMDALHDKVTPLEDAMQNLELEEAHQHALALIAFLTDAV